MGIGGQREGAEASVEKQYAHSLTHTVSQEQVHDGFVVNIVSVVWCNPE